LVDRIGNHWKRISEQAPPQFGPRERTEIKHRAKCVMNTHINLELMAQHSQGLTEQQATVSPVQETTFGPEEFFHGPASQAPGSMWPEKNAREIE
jgi:hypothetical protein